MRQHYLSDDLSKATTIFVGSSCDMWAEMVPRWWIQAVLQKCVAYRDVTFLFQTKNPARFAMFEHYPPKTILATTIESNREYALSKAPSVVERARAMHSMRRWKQQRMVSIEPVLDFDLDEFVAWIDALKPEFVSIGADSKHHSLPEPSADKLTRFIAELREITDVRLKANLARLGVT